MKNKGNRYLIIILVLCVVAFIVHFFAAVSPELAGAYEVVRVVDGDTLIVKMGDSEKYVRLIGVNAPESVHPDETKNTPEGVAASNYLKELLPQGSLVYLEYDVDRYDSYERTLAYVYLEDKETMVNLLLLENGYAELMTVPPNTKYEARFLSVK